MRLAGKVAIITGGGSGIGRSISILFAKEGAGIAVADVAAGGEQTAEVVKGAGGEAIFVKTDVSTSAAVKNLIDAVKNKYGKIDVLVNCAGILSPEGPIENHDEAAWDRVFAINVKGMFLTIKYTVPVMKSQGYGTIVNIASGAGVRPAPFRAAYASSKAAVITLTKAAALELASFKIRANYINPGAVDTPMLDEFGSDIKKKILSSVPLGRGVLPEDIAYAALYLASDEASILTGAGINVDGGLGI